MCGPAASRRGTRPAPTSPPPEAPAQDGCSAIPSQALGDLTRAWFPFGVHLIEGFFQTVRSMDTLSRQRESLTALGTLAAGLAHEMNNPASATARAVDALEDTCATLLSSLVRLAERSLTAEQFVAVERLRREIEAPQGASILWPRPMRKRRSRAGSMTTPWKTPGASLHRSPPPASASTGASGRRRCSTGTRSRPGSTGLRARCRPARAALRDEGLNVAHLSPGRCGEVVLAARRSSVRGAGP